jgi:hypothetical protein
MGFSVCAEQISVIDHPRRVAGYTAVLLSYVRRRANDSSEVGSRLMIQSGQSLRENCHHENPCRLRVLRRLKERVNVRDICDQRLTHAKRPV